MAKNKEYLPEDDRINHEYDHMSREELEKQLATILEKQKKEEEQIPPIRK